MSAVAVSSGRPDRGNPLLPIVFFASPLVTSAVPRLTPFFFALVGVALVGTALSRGTPWRRLLPWTPGLGACALLVLYVFLNATWAADRGAAFGKAALLAGLVLVTFAAVAAAATLDATSLRRAALAFAAGAFLGAVFVLVELLTDGVVTRTVMSWAPILQPHFPKHVAISHGEVTRMNPSKLNQNVNLVMFHLWPGLLALTELKGNRRRIAVAVFFATLAVAIAISQHDSSQVALIGSSLVLLLAWNWPRPVIRILAVLWCAAFVLVIPADFLAYRSELHMAPWLPESARARVILWEYTAERTLAHPWLGIGVESTPVLRDEDKAAAPLEQPEGFVFHRTTGQHAHDLFLQTWYELGAVGALLIALAGAAVVMLIPLLPLAALPFAAAAYAAFTAVAAFAWGMWQSWFMCAVGLVPLYLQIAAAVRQRAQERSRVHPGATRTEATLRARCASKD
jgi:hypothetical protein